MTQQKKTFRYFIFISILFISLVFFYVYNNFHILTVIANGFDQPSNSYSLIQKRLLKLLNSKEEKMMFSFLEEGQNEYLHKTYLRLLSLKGAFSDGSRLIKLYNNERFNSDSFFTPIIIAMGASGNLAYFPFLESLFEEYKHDDLKEFLIAQSLYLLTGIEFQYPSYQGKEDLHYNVPGRYFNASNELFKAREIVFDTRARDRLLPEMIALDRLIYR